ncbi:N-acetylmuramoyl-L-alanine amidase, partial [Candidatus Peregrinibacteria bacterium]|nr:N-acetylmuramoyl-L-alanine amidase [Candidatus Peregrinibacteria bacterium]
MLGKTPEKRSVSAAGGNSPERQIAAGVQARQELLASVSEAPIVDPEKLKEARGHLVSALDFIEKNIGKEKLERIGVHIDFRNPDRYLPLMIKESRLDNRSVSVHGALGYFQLKQGAVQDVRKVFRGDFMSQVQNFTSPLNNCIYGILYYHLVFDVYNERLIPAPLSPQERKLLGAMIYNGGPGNIKRLWKILKPQSYEDFEEKLNDAFAAQLGTSPGKASSVMDPEYRALYRQYPAAAKYLELLNKKDKILETPLTVNGKETGITLGKVGEMLRYTRLLEGIEARLKGGSTAPAVQEAKEPEKTAVPFLLRREKVQRTRRLWSMANDLLPYCRESNVPGCENTETDENLRKNVRDRLMTIILIYNALYNPVLKDIDVRADRDELPIPVGTEVLIPNKEFIFRYFKKTEDDDQELASRAKSVAESGEAREVKTAIPLYADAKLDSKGKTLLADRYRFDEKKEVKKYGRYGIDTMREGKYSGKRKETRYIILHSTDGENPEFTVSRNKANYVVATDGTIYGIVQRDYWIDHAGQMSNPESKSIWNGDGDVSAHSIGIEVAVNAGKEWNDEQYEAVKRLVH